MKIRGDNYPDTGGYLTDSDVAKKQVKAEHLRALDATWWEVPRALIEMQSADKAAPTGLVHLLLEGLSGTASCAGNPQALDLDGDRNPDTVIDLGNETPIDPDTRQPKVIPAGTVAVYLGTNTPQRDPNTNALLATWDLTRRQDTQPDLSHQGLLSTLSEADLADTDLYVYRTSNDQLIFSRKGLDPNRDTYLRGQGGGALDNGTAGFFYHSVRTEIVRIPWLEMAVLNKRHMAIPSTSPAWTPKLMIRRVH